MSTTKPRVVIPTRAEWRRRRTKIRFYWAGVLAFVLIVAFSASIGRKPYRRPIPASSVGSGAVTGPACYWDGGVSRAWQVDDSGPYVLIDIECADGIRYQVAR